MGNVEPRSRRRVKDEPESLQKIRVFVSETWAGVFLFLPTVAGTILSGTHPYPFPSPHWQLTVFGTPVTLQWFAFGLSLFAAAVGGIHLYRNRSRLRDEEARSDDLEQRLDVSASINSHYREGLEIALKRALWRLMIDLGFSETDASGENKLQAQVRATVYCHDPSRRVFKPIARIATDPTLESFAREEYPEAQGYIGECWTRGSSSAVDQDDDRNRWNEKLVQELHYTREEAESLRMHSKSYASIRLEIDQDRVGVLMLEHTAKRGIKRETADKLVASNWNLPIASLVATFREAWLHHLGHSTALPNTGQISDDEAP